MEKGLVNGVSRIRLSGPVRLLRGPVDSRFFAVDAHSGKQIALKRIGGGRIGVNSIFSKI